MSEELPKTFGVLGRKSSRILKVLEPNLIEFINYVTTHEEFTGTEIHNAINIPHATVNHWIKQLERRGVIVGRKKGKYKIYKFTYMM